MKNVYEVLRQKEMELTRLEKEVEALRLVAPLLSEEKGGDVRHGETRPGHRRQRSATHDADSDASRREYPGASARPRCRMGRHRQALAVTAAARRI